MLLVDVHALPDGVHELALRPEPAALDLDPALFEDLAVDLRLDVAGSRILALFEVRATATLECDRTLVEYKEHVAGTHGVLFAPAAQLPSGDEDDDAVPLPEDALSIDLTRPVRDTLLLALPQRRIAPGAEGVDLPTTFGALTDEGGRPIDPRWEALRDLRDGGDS